MAKVVYMLGAGFNCSVLMPSAKRSAPLARNFFQVLLRSRHDRWLDGFLGRSFVDTLFEEIERYWKLDRAALAANPFDIEECLTFFESKFTDRLSADDVPAMGNAAFGLRYLLLMYLDELNSEPIIAPAARRFGESVLSERADVLTFNYDRLADSAIELASGPPISTGPPYPPSLRGGAVEVPDDYLGASIYAWNRNLAYGIPFAEVSMPMAGISTYVSGERYYSHPANALYKDTRLLKLHGSIDWLRYTERRSIPPAVDSGHEAAPPKGIVLYRMLTIGKGSFLTAVAGTWTRRSLRLNFISSTTETPIRNYGEPPWILFQNARN